MVYLKVAMIVNLKSSHHRKIYAVTMRGDGWIIDIIVIISQYIALEMIKEDNLSDTVCLTHHEANSVLSENY